MVSRADYTCGSTDEIISGIHTQREGSILYVLCSRKYGSQKNSTKTLPSRSKLVCSAKFVRSV